MSLFMRNLFFVGKRLPRLNGPQTLFCRRYADDYDPQFDKIGDREIVGYGKNSMYFYIDHPGFPFPSIRFQEMTPELCCLREKEKGDWRNLTMEEKKTLYRASFCQTYSEFLAETGEWKSVVGWSLIWISAGLWLYILISNIWKIELPDSFTAESREAQLKRMLILEVNPITGLASKWDYENKKWK